ncbi:MAG: efflux RND transporter periplasmic adaptor subunit [Rhodocyclaceae bacterium]|jgi:HlyD family secretion protein|nr:efflux RND transporter periplasmic adaptor subunit [Rhodocyclaceae bacterium]
MIPARISLPWGRRAVIFVLAIAVLGSILFWLSRPKPVSVAVHSVEKGVVEASVVNTRAGTLEACQRTKLSTIMGGRIEYLGVKEGDRVKKGQLLMKLWNDDQKAQQSLAETQREMARRRVTEVCTVAAGAVREARRQSDLRAKGFISSSREDSSRTDAEARQAACETAKADVAQAEARIGVSRAEQGRTSLYAPFDGTVAKIVGELGEYSTPSPPGVQTPPAIDLIDDSCLYVTAPMDEVDAPKISVGQLVRINLDALPGQPLAGKVRRIAPYVSALEKQARTVDVEVDFVDPQAPQGSPSGSGADQGKRAALLVGYSADVEIVLQRREGVLRVPTATLIEGNKVLVLASDGKLVERAVKTGIANWEYTEVLEGVVAGDQVVTSLDRAGVKAGVAAVLGDAEKK